MFNIQKGKEFLQMRKFPLFYSNKFKKYFLINSLQFYMEIGDY